MTTQPHRDIAAALLAATADHTAPGYRADAPANDLAAMAAVATTHTLLAIETRLAELVEQQRLSNVIAVVTAAASEESALEMGYTVRGDAMDYVRHAITVIVTPSGHDDQPE